MADVYIDPATGNDLSGDGSSAYPYASIQGAYDATPPADATVFHLSDAASDVLTADIDSSSPNNWNGSRHAIVGWDRGNGGYGVIDGDGSYRCTGSSQQKTFWHKIEFTNGNTTGNLFNAAGTCIDCKFTNTGGTNYKIIPKGCALIGCLFDNVGSSDNGTMANGGNNTYMHKCLFKAGSNSVYAVYRGYLHATNSVFWLNGSSTVLWDGGHYNLTNCILYQQSTGSGNAISPAGSVGTRSITNCYFEGWNYAIYAAYGQNLVSNNAFYNNSTNVDNSQSHMYYDAGTDLVLSASGLTDPSNGDFTPTSDLIAKGFPTNIPGTSTATNFPIGAITAASRSGGSGSSSSSGSKWTTITDLTGLVAWYKPETLASTYSNGDSITTWADSSGNSRDLTGSGTTRPLAAANAFGTYMAADFDGTDDVLSTASYQQAPNPCYSIVFEMDVLKNFNGPITIMNQNPPAWFTGVGNLSWVTTLIHSNGKIQINRFKDTTSLFQNSLDGAASATTKYIMTISYNEDNHDMRLNGSEVADSVGSTTSSSNAFPSLDTAYIHLGHGGHSSSPFNGKIVEAVVYDTVDTDNANSIWVEGYLADKYGITLADGHLFKNAAPQNSPTTYNATSSGGSSYTNVAAAKFTRLE